MILRDARVDDLPILPSIFDEAFREDAHTQLQIAWRGRDSMLDGMAIALRHWHSDPKYHLIVAEGLPTGTTLGWACWSLGREASSANQPQRDAPDPVSESSIDALNEITSGDIARCQREVLRPGDKVCILVSVAVSPQAQKHGVGRLLVGWGTDYADAHDQRSWVHASEVGSRAFERLGFRRHRELRIDLDRYSPPQSERQWGPAIFRSMVRPPVQAVLDSHQRPANTPESSS